MIYLALPVSSDHGWGIAGKYISLSLARLAEVRLCTPPLAPENVNDEFELHALQQLRLSPAEDAQRRQCDGLMDGPLLTAIAPRDMRPVFPEFRSRFTTGYCFFEENIPPTGVENAKRLYKHIATGSTWCTEKLRSYGLTEVSTAIQGIDPEIFRPLQGERQFFRDRFVVFSGGKFEFRKGQDIVIRAFKALQDKHSDAVLVTAWTNKWPDSVASMRASQLIDFKPPSEDRASGFNQVLADNGIDLSRVVQVSLRPHATMARIYHNTDVGLFPNRCEGGTNLVMMEYMACGKPVIASNASGHRDVLTAGNSLRIEELTPMTVMLRNDDVPLANWDDPSLDETIARLEFAYEHRGELRSIGEQAARDMQRFTWQQTAECFLKLLQD